VVVSGHELCFDFVQKEEVGVCCLFGGYPFRTPRKSYQESDTHNTFGRLIFDIGTTLFIFAKIGPTNNIQPQNNIRTDYCGPLIGFRYLFNKKICW